MDKVYLVELLLAEWEQAELHTLENLVAHRSKIILVDTWLSFHYAVRTSVRTCVRQAQYLEK